MCGQPGGYGQQMQMPKFNPMTTNPYGGPPGHFANQQPTPMGIQPPRMPDTNGQFGQRFTGWQQPQQPMAPQMQPHYAQPPQGYAGSTGTGEPMPMGQQQPAQPTTVPPWMQDPTMGQTFAFNRRPFR